MGAWHCCVGVLAVESSATSDSLDSLGQPVLMMLLRGVARTRRFITRETEEGGSPKGGGGGRERAEGDSSLEGGEWAGVG